MDYFHTSQFFCRGLDCNPCILKANISTLSNGFRLNKQTDVAEHNSKIVPPVNNNSLHFDNLPAPMWVEFQYLD
ncbi:hypothetical protein AB669_03075 [Pedobacter sp. BMA]|nr:hypothetical protein AB669_03075 [Pedobacter sp. BMA]